MIRHVVMWKVAGRSADERSEARRRVQAAFEGLRGRIPGMTRVEIGADVSGVDYACDLVLVADFDGRGAARLCGAPGACAGARGTGGPADRAPPGGLRHAVTGNHGIHLSGAPARVIFGAAACAIWKTKCRRWARSVRWCCARRSSAPWPNRSPSGWARVPSASTTGRRCTCRSKWRGTRASSPARAARTAPSPWAAAPRSGWARRSRWKAACPSWPSRPPMRAVK